MVADVEHRGAVAGLRALGRAGLRPLALGADRSSAGLWSRYAAGSASVSGGAAGFERALEQLTARHGPIIVYPATEPTLERVLAASALPGVLAPFPEAVRALRRKDLLGEAAAGSGLRVATTLHEGSAAELLQVLPRFPCAVKATRPAGALSMTRVVRDRHDWEALLRQLPADEPLLVQPRLEGPVRSVDLVVDRDGGVVARCQHEAARTWPALAGSTAWARTVVPDDDLVARAGRMLAGVGHWGLVNLEFLHDADGPVLIDANPRFYGCLALPLAAGVDLPSAWHRVALGEPAGRPGPYRVGVTYRWLEADVVAALKGSPGRLVPRERADTGAMWASDDPLPGPLLAVNAVARRTVQRMGWGGDSGDEGGDRDREGRFVRDGAPAAVPAVIGD